MNGTVQQNVGAPPAMGPILLETERVAEMRSMLHELANVFTGILITSGLLAQKLESEQAGCAQSLCNLGERGSGLVRQTRALLLAAMGVETSGESEG